MPTATVALAGNAFLTTVPAKAVEVINVNGLENWTNPDTICSVYFRVDSAAEVVIGLNAYLADSSDSTVKVTVNETPFTIQLAGTTTQTYSVGTVSIAAPVT